MKKTLPIVSKFSELRFPKTTSFNFCPDILGPMVKPLRIQDVLSST